MYNPLHARPSAIVQEKVAARRFAAATATLALGAALATGITHATFTDGEYGHTGYTAGRYNLQIAADVAPNLADTDWKETSPDGQPDNSPETGVTTPINLTTTGGSAMIPGLADSQATTLAYIKNASNVDSTLNLSLVDQTTTTSANAAAKGLLRFDLVVDELEQGEAPMPVYVAYGKALTDLDSDAKALPIVAAAPPGAMYRITLTATMANGTDQAATNAAQGGQVDLWLAVKGAATA
ncbi:MAG: hypothetical protein LBR27_05035 [Bifidobacteriaceae bacterium]|jgi:hypothetical protein|nr:hypothetical protein [Bifidobacteriaceae bacterium]